MKNNFKKITFTLYNPYQRKVKEDDITQLVAWIQPLRWSQYCFLASSRELSPQVSSAQSNPIFNRARDPGCWGSCKDASQWNAIKLRGIFDQNEATTLTTAIAVDDLSL